MKTEPFVKKRLFLLFSEKDFIRLKTAKIKTFLTWEHFILKLLKGGKNGK